MDHGGGRFLRAAGRSSCVCARASVARPALSTRRDRDAGTGERIARLQTVADDAIAVALHARRRPRIRRSCILPSRILALTSVSAVTRVCLSGACVCFSRSCVCLARSCVCLARSRVHLSGASILSDSHAVPGDVADLPRCTVLVGGAHRGGHALTRAAASLARCALRIRGACAASVGASISPGVSEEVHRRCLPILAANHPRCHHRHSGKLPRRFSSHCRWHSAA
jgi:hypothetical protein